jgi:hypothetical protein
MSPSAPAIGSTQISSEASQFGQQNTLGGQNTLRPRRHALAKTVRRLASLDSKIHSRGRIHSVHVTRVSLGIAHYSEPLRFVPGQKGG